MGMEGIDKIVVNGGRSEQSEAPAAASDASIESHKEYISLYMYLEKNGNQELAANIRNLKPNTKEYLLADFGGSLGRLKVDKDELPGENLPQALEALQEYEECLDKDPTMFTPEIKNERSAIVKKLQAIFR